MKIMASDAISVQTLLELVQLNSAIRLRTKTDEFIKDPGSTEKFSKFYVSLRSHAKIYKHLLEAMAYMKEEEILDDRIPLLDLHNLRELEP